MTDRIEPKQNLLELLENTNVAVIIIDKNNHMIQFASETAAAMTNTTVDKMIGRKCQCYICPANEGECPVGDKGLDLKNSRWPLLKPNGTATDVLKSVYPIEYNSRSCFLETLIDISKIKEVYDETELLTKKLKNNEERMNLAMDVGHEGIWDFNGETNTLHFDSHFYTMAGYENEEFPIDFYQWQKRIHQDYVEEVKQELNLFLSEQKKVYNCEFKYQCKNGNYMWIQARGSVVGRDKLGRANRYIGIHLDITENKQREKRTQLLNSLQEQLLQPRTMEKKAKLITNTIISAADAFLAIIWMIGKDDLCKEGCTHYKTELFDNYCFKEKKCLHLIASSGYTGSIEGKNRRVPMGSYRIGSIFTGKSDKMIIDNLGEASFVDDRKWIDKNELQSFAGFKLTDLQNNRIGVLALFSKRKLNDEMETYLESIANLTSQVIINDRAESALIQALNSMERANNLMNGREIRVRQIKEEVNRLHMELGHERKYTMIDSGSESDIHIIPKDNDESWKNALSLAEDAEIARRELQETNEQLSIIKQAVNSSSDGVGISTVNGDFFYINNSFTHMFGYNIGQLALLSHEALFLNSLDFTNSLELAEKGTPHQGEISMISRITNKALPVFMRSAPFFDKKNRLIGIVWNFTDISEQKKSEAKIKEYTATIERDLNEKKETLKKATLLQHNFIQKDIPLLGNFNIHTLFMPCENLGGDFFRILKGVRENKLVIIIGDCTDHGIKASMDASLLSSLIDPNLSKLYEDNRTDHFLSRISKDFMKLADEDQYPTMMAIIIDLQVGEMYYSNANSELPYLLRGKEATRVEKARGMHIGYFEDPDFERKKHIFQPGDKLLLYSDAVIEVKNANGTRLNRIGFEEILNLNRGNNSQSFHSLIDKLYKINKGFPLEDDTTLIQLEYLSRYKYDFTFNSLDQWNNEISNFKTVLLKYDYLKDEIEEICIALSELTINAHVHGNRSAPDKYVSVTGIIDCAGITLDIKDMGDGFEFENVPDPVSNIQEILKRDIEEEYTHGRGIKIARDILNSIVWNDTGNCVSIKMQKTDRKIFNIENFKALTL